MHFMCLKINIFVYINLKKVKMEVWKKVVENDKYEVSNLGNVKSLHRGIILKQSTLTAGYKQVSLSKDGKVVSRLVHRLVAQAFLPNPEDKPEVNHINGVKTDNNINNLEWSTRSENQLHSITAGLRSAEGTKNSQAKLNDEKALLIFNDTRMYKEIAAEYSVSVGTICDIKRGRSWTHVTGLKKDTE